MLIQALNLIYQRAMQASLADIQQAKR